MQRSLCQRDWIHFCEVGAGGIRCVVPERYHIIYHIISYHIIPDDHSYYYSLISEISSLGLWWIWTGHQKVTITPTSVRKNQFFMLFYIFIYLFIIIIIIIIIYLFLFYFVFFFGGGGSLYLTHHDGKFRLNPLSHQPCAVFLLHPFSGVETGTQSFDTDDWGKSPEKSQNV